MRKLLLASVAALGLTGAYGAANAQQADDSGQATVSAQGGATTGLTQAPGTLVVRLNGRVFAQTGYWNVSNANNTTFFNPVTGQANVLPFVGGPSLTSTGPALPQFFGTAAQLNTLLAHNQLPGFTSASQLAVVPNQPQSNKMGNVATYSYLRLYPGFDGVAANGLMYGAGVEIRQDGNWPAGNGLNGGISADSARQGILYVRRNWVYLGTADLGIVRMGETDGPASLFMVGNNENFGDGGLNGSAFAYLPNALWYYWPYADGGSFYSVQRVMYLSPSIAGFDFGVSFAPTSAGAMGAASTQGCNAPSGGIAGFTGNVVAGPGIAGAGCALLASTSTGDIGRFRNEYEVGLRYRGLFGPIGVAAYADYIGSAAMGDTMLGAHQKFDGYSIGSGGLQLTYGGFTFGTMGRGGRVNNTGSWNLAPQGAAPEVDWEIGGSYTYGPVVVGAHVSQSWLAGFSGPAFNNDGTPTGVLPSVGQRRERGVAVGATYSVAPGLALSLTYVWADRQESGTDLLTSQTSYANNVLNHFGCKAISASATTACLHNGVTVSMIALGASLTW